MPVIGGQMFAVGFEDVWWLTTDQMRDVDRIVVADFGVDLVRMMENAGRSLAELAVLRFDPASVVVLAGRGGNGGGGLAAARHLANRGLPVSAVLSSDSMGGVPAQQLEIARRAGVRFVAEPPETGPVTDALVIDALVGYGMVGTMGGRSAELVEWANASPAPVLSLDTPSGLDTTTGTGAVCVVADATLTLAMPKVGLRSSSAVVGELYLADISIPPRLYRQLGFALGPSPFRRSPIVRIDPSV